MSNPDQSPPRTENGDIGAFPIDPNAEPLSTTPPSVSGQEETDFYKRSGAQYQLAHNQQNLGFLGKFFGSNSSAPTNIAGLVIAFSMIALFVSLFVQGNAELAEARKWLIGLITSAMSFIFGAASRR